MATSTLDMSDQQPQHQHQPQPHIPATKERFRTRCCYCLSHTLWIILVLIIILVMLIILVLYILITPRGFRFHVTNANLSQFDYTNNTNTLRYNIILNITAQNPNKKIKIYYDAVEATALYEGVRFATADVNMPWRSYLQDKKSKNQFSAVFAGQRVVVLNRKQVSEFNDDNKDGVFPIDVKIRFQYRFRIDGFQLGYYYAKGTCGLKVPLDGKTVSATAFDPTTCEIVF